MFESCRVHHEFMIDISNYSGILIQLFLITGFLTTMILLASLLGPKNRTATKDLPFECGAVSVGDIKQQRFSVRYYLVAMVFILFDIEAIFLYLWAPQVRQLGFSGLTAVLAFMVLISLGLVYIWRKGILNWNDN